MNKELKEAIIAEREKWEKIIDIKNISIFTNSGEEVVVGGIFIDLQTMEYLKKRVIKNIDNALKNNKK